MPADCNPYRPTDSLASGTPMALPPDDAPRAWRGFPLLWALALLPYGAFTVAMLRSTAADRQAGLLFTFNCAVLAGGVIAAMFDNRRSPTIGLVAAAVQVVIMLVMLGAGIGDLAPVLLINLAIAAGFLALAALSHYLVRRGRHRLVS